MPPCLLHFDFTAMRHFDDPHAFSAAALVLVVGVSVVRVLGVVPGAPSRVEGKQVEAQ